METTYLIIEIVTLATGSGILVKLYQHIKRSGKNEAILKGLREDIRSFERHMVTLPQVEKMIGEVEASVGDKLSDEISGVHKRVDIFNNQLSEIKRELGSVAETIRSMRKDWEGLQVEIRQLLRSDASVGADVTHLKERVRIFEERLENVGERTSSLQASVQDLQRRQDRK